MNIPQPTKKDFSYKHDRQGFMIYYKGQEIGGLGSIREDYIVDDQDHKAKEYEKTAKEYIKKLLDGSFGKYESTIRRVDKVFNTPKGE